MARNSAIPLALYCIHMDMSGMQRHSWRQQRQCEREIMHSSVHAQFTVVYSAVRVRSQTQKRLAGIGKWAPRS